MKLLVTLLSTFTLFATAQAAHCNLYFQNGYNYKSGSVEGTCSFRDEVEVPSGQTPNLLIEVRGLDYNERAVIYSGRLPYTHVNSHYLGYADGNKNGKGTVVGNLRLHNVNHWRSRYVEVVIYSRTTGKTYRIFSGRI